MQTDRQELAETYRCYSDQEIASLHAQIDSLTLEARDALTIEIEQRGLKSEDLAKLHASEQRHEAKFERLQKTRRKKLAIYMLLGPRPRYTLISLVGGFVAILLWELFRRSR